MDHRQLSIVGIDDLEFAGLLEPQPTAIATPILQMAQQAIHDLLDQISGKNQSNGQWFVYAPKLVVRASTAPLGGRQSAMSGPRLVKS